MRQGSIALIENADAHIAPALFDFLGQAKQPQPQWLEALAAKAGTVPPPPLEHASPLVYNRFARRAAAEAAEEAVTI